MMDGTSLLNCILTQRLSLLIACSISAIGEDEDFKETLEGFDLSDYVLPTCLTDTIVDGVYLVLDEFSMGYSMNNSIRFDLSDYLIHFFRDIDQLGTSAIILPDHMGWQNIYEGTTLPAFFMLRTVLRNGRLWATWSMRNGKRTIYGKNPAVCFTEMPIPAFLHAGKDRCGKKQAMSPLGIVFRKEALYKLGARPVISGFSKDATFSSFVDSSGNRLLDESILPSNEQYRYVTFDIGGDKNIDWTHEREWRWPCRDDFSTVNDQMQEFGIVSSWDEIPGLDFYDSDISEIGVIVETQKQAELVVRDMLTLVDSLQVSRRIFSFVLVSELLPDPTHLQDPVSVAQSLAKATVNLNPYFSQLQAECNKYSIQFSELVRKIEASTPSPTYGEFGGCWLWLHDNTAPLTRALLKIKRAFVTSNGRYLVPLYEFSDSRCLRERENMTYCLARIVSDDFNTSCSYFSVSGSEDPMEVPFYTSGFDDETSFFNFSFGV